MGVGWGGDPRRGVRTREGGKSQTRARRSKRHPHPNQTRDTHTPTLTYSHTLGQVPTCRPPCRDTQNTLNSSRPDTQNTSLDTQGDPDPALPPPPTESRVGSRQQQEGGGKDSRRQLRMCSQRLCKLGVSVATLLSQDLVSQDNLGHLARGSCHSFPHS